MVKCSNYEMEYIGEYISGLGSRSLQGQIFRPHNLPSKLQKVYCGPHPFLINSLLLFLLNLGSETSNVAPTSKRNPTAAKQNPAEETQVELSMHV